MVRSFTAVYFACHTTQARATTRVVCLKILLIGAIRAAAQKKKKAERYFAEAEAAPPAAEEKPVRCYTLGCAPR